MDKETKDELKKHIFAVRNLAYDMQEKCDCEKDLEEINIYCNHINKRIDKIKRILGDLI